MLKILTFAPMLTIVMMLSLTEFSLKLDRDNSLSGTPEHIFEWGGGAYEIGRGPIWAWLFRFMLVLLRSR